MLFCSFLYYFHSAFRRSTCYHVEPVNYACQHFIFSRTSPLTLEVVIWFTLSQNKTKQNKTKQNNLVRPIYTSERGKSQAPLLFLFSFSIHWTVCWLSAVLLVLSMLSSESKRLEAWELYFLEYKASKYPSLDSVSGRQLWEMRKAER